MAQISVIITVNMLIELALYVFAFILLWFGSGVIVNSIDHFTKRLRLSPFTISFFILGLLTSIPEFAVGLTSVVEGKPEIFVGNLLGGAIVLFLLVIPLLAIIGNGIRINHDLSNLKMIVTLGTILAPALLALDNKISNPEGVVLIVMYVMLFIILQKKGNLFTTLIKNKTARSRKSGFIILKIIFGVILVTIASSLILDETFYFANLFKIAPFYVSLIALSIGTNLPELSIAMRSILKGKKDIAFGDYMGSAAANTLLFGIFTLLNKGKAFYVHNFFITFLFMVGGLTVFFLFSRTKKDISRREGIVLLSIYIFSIMAELILP